MPPRTSTNKAKAAGVSTSSFLDLKAELATKEQEFAKDKAAGKATTGGAQRTGKKPTVWSRANKGVNARAARDIELETISKPTLESARAILERKSQIYEKLRKGKTGGLSEKQYEALLVDFDSKVDNASSSDDEDIDESLSVPKRPETEVCEPLASLIGTTVLSEYIQDDPVIEYEDEFGRLRTAPRSEIPRNLLPPDPKDDPIIEYQDEFGRMRTARKSQVPEHLLPPEDDDPDVIYNPVGHFPVYEPSADRVAEIEKEYAEENNPLNLHYDASKEVRAKGAGFYQFSGDDETRRRQLEELRLAREETERTRQDTGAINTKFGEVEGMQSESGNSRALEKRKRDLEQRRKLLDAKRRKVKGNDEAKGEIGAPLLPSLQQGVPTYTVAVQPNQPLDGPIAVEDRSLSTTTADDFLAQLERDMLGRNGP